MCSLALRAKADRQARFLVARLATVLALGETAAVHIGRINTLYGTSMSLHVYFADTCNHIIQKIIKCSVIYVYTIVNPFMPGVSTPFVGSN